MKKDPGVWLDCILFLLHINEPLLAEDGGEVRYPSMMELLAEALSTAKD